MKKIIEAHAQVERNPGHGDRSGLAQSRSLLIRANFVSAVPEPGTIALASLALLAMGFARRPEHWLASVN